MNRIFMGVLEIIASAVILIPIYFLLNKSLFRNVRKSIIYCIFSFYLVAVYTLVGMPNVTYIRLDFTMNLIPILGMIDDLKNSILNVLLFIPLGIMLPIVWNPYRAKKDTMLFGFGMSLVIEIFQIFTFRATDINDLITNVLGTAIGFFFANVLMKKFPAIKNAVAEKKSRELYLVCVISFAVMFFIQPFIAPVMWNGILY